MSKIKHQWWDKPYWESKWLKCIQSEEFSFPVKMGLISFYVTKASSIITYLDKLSKPNFWRHLISTEKNLSSRSCGSSPNP